MSTDALRMRRRRLSALTVLGAGGKWVFLAVGVITALVPFIWMVSGSIRSEADLFGDPASLLPTSATLHGYIGVWQQLPFIRLLLNSLLFAGLTTALCRCERRASPACGGVRRDEHHRSNGDRHLIA